MALTNLQLDRVLSRHFHTRHFYRGIYDIDTLPDYFPNGHKPGFIISSTTRETAASGHWVACFFQKQASYFFCSFGHSPAHYSTSLDHFMAKSSKKECVFNSTCFQPSDSVTCGYYTLYVADLMCQGWAFNQILQSFSSQDLQRNDIVVQGFYRHHFHDV